MADNGAMECAVCLQTCNHPTQLPCGHIFCFLCVKGVAIQNKFCALCRQQIPADYLDHPVLLNNYQITNSEHINGDHQWYYEGRNGWWKYDERSNMELEGSFAASEPDCMLLLAGALYRVDFTTMLQTRRTDPTRRRRVKRDTPTLPAKGVAGIKLIPSEEVIEDKNSDPAGNRAATQTTNNTVVTDTSGTLDHSEVSPQDLYVTPHSELAEIVHEEQHETNTEVQYVVEAPQVAIIREVDTSQDTTDTSDSIESTLEEQYTALQSLPITSSLRSLSLHDSLEYDSQTSPSQEEPLSEEV